jgi:hypothetical protein
MRDDSNEFLRRQFLRYRFAGFALLLGIIEAKAFFDFDVILKCFKN